ncbi:hypothetical protein EMIT0194MI4_60307 [Pseudomonas sp. IT-194MI4]
MVEHDLAKVGVASSSLVSRSNFKQRCFRAKLSETRTKSSDAGLGTETHTMCSGQCVPFV